MFLERLKLNKILSFNDSVLEFQPLNVLIGPNAVGKSNLIEVIGLLQSAPMSLHNHMMRGGSLRQWFWLGDSAPSPIAVVECTAKLSRRPETGSLAYNLRMSEESTGFIILEERLRKSSSTDTVYFDRRARDLRMAMSNGDRTQTGPSGSAMSEAVGIPQNESVFALSKNPLDPTPTTELGKYFSRIRIYREFRTSSLSGMRRGITTNARPDSLDEGAENLPLVLQRLHVRKRHERLREYLRRFCERFDDVKIDIREGLAQILLEENGLIEPLIAARMSDGTLKFLAILAALFDPAPDPAPLICIEEPEIGLHPEAMRLVAEALVEASESVQLVVTTHSDALIDALSDQPESVVVCERGADGGTVMKRLDRSRLQEWLAEYTLGELWRRGEIGGGLRS